MKNLSAGQVDYRAFQELGVQVLGIAAEHAFSQRPFADSLDLPYPLLSDHPAVKGIQRSPGLPPPPKVSRPTRASRRIPVPPPAWRHGGRWSSPIPRASSDGSGMVRRPTSF